MCKRLLPSATKCHTVITGVSDRSHSRSGDSSMGAASAGRPSAVMGFTLVELLVVVGIIAVLSALLLPSLSKARERAQAMVCLGNEKQMTGAGIMYADDQDGWLPYTDRWVCDWMFSMAPYLGATRTGMSNFINSATSPE